MVKSKDMYIENKVNEKKVFILYSFPRKEM